jgi:hypothetical protein
MLAVPVGVGVGVIVVQTGVGVGDGELPRIGPVESVEVAVGLVDGGVTGGVVQIVVGVGLVLAFLVGWIECPCPPPLPPGPTPPPGGGLVDPVEDGGLLLWCLRPPVFFEVGGGVTRMVGLPEVET